MAEKCITCGETVQVYHFCDTADVSGPWCCGCFEQTPCGQGKHSEGCETLVFDSPTLKDGAANG